MQTLQLAPSPKPPGPPVLLCSCFPACAQEWGEAFPHPLSPPLKAAPFLPWGSEKLTDPQDGGHLSSLHPGPCSPALGFPSRPEGPNHPSHSACVSLEDSSLRCRDPLTTGRDCACRSALLRGSVRGCRGPREEGFFRHAGARGPPQWSRAPPHPSVFPQSPFGWHEGATLWRQNQVIGLPPPRLSAPKLSWVLIAPHRVQPEGGPAARPLSAPIRGKSNSTR